MKLYDAIKESEKQRNVLLCAGITPKRIYISVRIIWEIVYGPQSILYFKWLEPTDSVKCKKQFCGLDVIEVLEDNYFKVEGDII